MQNTFGVGMESGHCKLLSGHTFVFLQTFASNHPLPLHEGTLCEVTENFHAEALENSRHSF